MISLLSRNVLFPLNEVRERTHVLDDLRRLEKSEYGPPDALAEFRLRKLRALVDHAFHHVPFYRKRFAEAGISPKDVRDFADLRKLPRLSKADIVNNLPDLVATNFSASAIHRDATSGSTGTHTPFYRNNGCMDTKKAAEYRFNRWTGWRVGEKVALVWPVMQDLRPR